MSEETFIKKAIKYLGCDTARISKPCGKLFLVIGWNRNTKQDIHGYWTKNGKRFDFDYIEEKVVANGTDLKELWESVKHYKKVLRIGWRAFFSKEVCKQIEAVKP